MTASAPAHMNKAGASSFSIMYYKRDYGQERSRLQPYTRVIDVSVITYFVMSRDFLLDYFEFIWVRIDLAYRLSTIILFRHILRYILEGTIPGREIISVLVGKITEAT